MYCLDGDLAGAVALAIMIGFAWVYIALLCGGVMSVDPAMGITEFAG